MWKVYFDVNGNQYDRSVHWHYEHYLTDEELAKEGLTRRDNFVFKDKLRVTKIINNRMYLVSENNDRKYSVFHSDIIKFIPQLVNGYIEGFFTFRKNGCYVGLIPCVTEYEDYTPKETTVFNIKGPFTSHYVRS